MSTNPEVVRAALAKANEPQRIFGTSNWFDARKPQATSNAAPSCQLSDVRVFIYASGSKSSMFSVSSERLSDAAQELARIEASGVLIDALEVLEGSDHFTREGMSRTFSRG
jgi:hypothetical protein